jgi:hypothetical protein
MPLDNDALYLRLLDPGSYSGAALDDLDVFKHEYAAHGSQTLKAADASPDYLWTLAQHSSHSGQKWLIVALLVMMAGAAAWGLMGWRRGKPPVIVLAMLGGMLWSLSEPVWDVLGHLYIYESGMGHWYTFLGRSMGPWVVVAYAWAGLVSYITYRFVVDGVPFAKWKWALVISVLANVVLEVPATRLGIYRYWGTQPLMVDNFPLHWAFINQGGLFAGIVLGVAARSLHGWRMLVMVPLYFCCATGFELFSGTPVYLALNAHGLYSDPPMWAATVGSLISIGVATTAILTAGYLASRSPVAESARRSKRTTVSPYGARVEPAAELV